MWLENLCRCSKYYIIKSYVKVKIDKMQQNNKCWLCRYETINRILSEYSKLEPKSIRQVTIGWRMSSTGNCSRSLNLTIWTNWYMQNPESVLENKTQKIHRDFEIQTDRLILTKRPNLMTVNKKIKRSSRIVDFAVPADHKLNWRIAKRVIST